jgi:DNA-binding Xre family transcriptional regulator
MKLSFEKIMAEHNISLEELPKDVQLTINEVSELRNRIMSKKQIGQAITPETMEKLKAKDRMLVKELLDYDEERNDDDDEEDDDASGDKSGSEDDEEDNDYDDGEGLAVDQELEGLSKAGLVTISLNDLRSKAPKSYDILFDTYGQDEENGIVTSNFSLTETAVNSQEFKLSKN